MFSFRNIAISTSAIAFAAAEAGKGNADKGDNFKVALNGMIDDIAKSEGTTHTLLATVSRDLLTYTPLTGDTGMVNRLLKSLGKANRNMTMLYFKAFLEWDLSEEGLFTEKFKAGRVTTRIEADRAKWLAGQKNNVWTWEKARRAPTVYTDEQKHEQAIHRIETAVKRAMTEYKAKPEEIIAALKAGGVSVDTILELADVMRADKEQAEADDKERNEEEAVANPPVGDVVNVPAAHVIEAAKSNRRQRGKAAN